MYAVYLSGLSLTDTESHKVRARVDRGGESADYIVVHCEVKRCQSSVYGPLRLLPLSTTLSIRVAGHPVDTGVDVRELRVRLLADGSVAQLPRRRLGSA